MSGPSGPRAELLRRGAGALARSATWWAVGVAGLVVLNCAFWPSLRGSEALTSLEKASGDLLKAFGAQNISTSAGYIDGQIFALMLPLLMSGMAIAMTTALTAGDEDGGRLELLHALPLSRRAIWLSRLAAVGGALALVGVATSAVAMASAAAFSLDGVAPGRVVAATAACMVLAAFHAAVAFALAGAGRSRGQSVAGAFVVLVVVYLVSVVFPLAESLRGFRRFSPWWWTVGEQPVSNGVSGPLIALTVGVSAALVVIGLVALDHRDIRSA